MPFLRQLYKQKPQAWGPVSSVQASIFKNAEIIGIDPTSIVLAMPMWGPGNQLDYSKNNRIFTPGSGVTFSQNSLKTTNDANGVIDLGSTFSPNNVNNFTVIQSCKINTIDSFSLSSRTNTSAGGFEFLIGSSSTYGNVNLRYTDDETAKTSATATGLNNGRYHQLTALLDSTNNTATFMVDSNIIDASLVLFGSITNTQNLFIDKRGTTYRAGDHNYLWIASAIWKTSQIAHLSDNPYFLLHRVAPVFYSVPGGAITIITSLDGKVIIRTATAALLDCMASIKNNAGNILDGAAVVSTTKTDAIDGKTILKSVASSIFDSKASVLSVASLLLDGNAIVSDTGAALFDGKGTVKDSAYDLVDGKSIIKSTNAAILDGKSIFLSTGTPVIDGKIIVNAEGFSSAFLDGKTSIKSVATNYLDGLIYIGNAADKNIDGKAIIKSSVGLTIDGKTTIQDVASNLLDGSASILTSIANIVDGKIVISDAAIGLLDGEAVILDDSSIILDGKVFLSSGSEINIFDGKITLSVPIVGKVTVSFSMRSPSVSFSIRTPAATFSIN